MGLGIWVLGFGLWVYGLGFRVGFGFRVRVWHLGLRCRLSAQPEPQDPKGSDISSWNSLRHLCTDLKPCMVTHTYSNPQLIVTYS